MPQSAIIIMPASGRLCATLCAAASLWAATASAATCSTTLTSKAAPVVANGYSARLVATNLTRPRSLLFDSAGNLLVVQSGKGIASLSLRDDGGTCVTVAGSPQDVVLDRSVSALFFFRPARLLGLNHSGPRPFFSCPYPHSPPVRVCPEPSPSPLRLSTFDPATDFFLRNLPALFPAASRARSPHASRVGRQLYLFFPLLSSPHFFSNLHLPSSPPFLVRFPSDGCRPFEAPIAQFQHSPPSPPLSRWSFSRCLVWFRCIVGSRSPRRGWHAI